MNDITVAALDAVSEHAAEELYALEKECFSGEAWSLDGIRGFYSDDKVALVAAYADGRIVGCASAISVCDEAEILKVAVAADHRRRGAARSMIAVLETILSERGVRRVLLEVRAGNAAARALYGSLGYAEYGVRRSYYESPRENAILMEKRIGGGVEQTPNGGASGSFGPSER